MSLVNRFARRGTRPHARNTSSPRAGGAPRAAAIACLENLEDRKLFALIVGGDYQGADLLPANGDVLSGTFTNVGRFEIDAGETVLVQPGTLLSVQAQNVLIDGVLNG